MCTCGKLVSPPKQSNQMHAFVILKVHWSFIALPTSGSKQITERNERFMSGTGEKLEFSSGRNKI